MYRYLKCYFKLITWKRDGVDRWCYAYSTTPSYQCSASAGGTDYSMRVSVESSSNSDEEYTSWLSDNEGKALPREQALQMKSVYGEIAYFRVDEACQFSLFAATDFKALPMDEQNVVASLHQSA